MSHLSVPDSLNCRSVSGIVNLLFQNAPCVSDLSTAAIDYLNATKRIFRGIRFCK